MDNDERMCQKFKQEFRKQLEFYKDNPDGLLFAYGAALNVFAKRLNSRPNSKHISETWNELIRSVLMTMLDIIKQPKAVALKKFVTLLQPWTENDNVISDIKENILMLHNLAINGAWEKPVLQSLLNKEKIDIAELSGILKEEPSLVVVNRVRALHKNQLKKSMLKVLDAALMDKKFCTDDMFQECFQLHIAYNYKADFLFERCKDFDFSVSLKVLEKFDQDENKKLSLTFSDVVMRYIWKKDLITSDIEKLTTWWCRIKLSGHEDNAQFVDFLKSFVRQEDSGPKSVTHCLIFMQIIWEMIGNQSREVCSDILMRALRLLATESDPDNQNKIQILETIARLLPKTNVSRLCLLCVFFLEPCIETYYCVSDAFNSTLKNEGTKSAELQTELLLHINNEFPKGPQFEMLDWNQINEECLAKLSPEDVNLLLNDSRSPLERQTSESTDTSVDEESSATQEKETDANKCSKCTTETTCASCQDKTLPVKEKPPKRQKKKKYGWTCPVDQCKVLSGRMMYLCTHLKNKHQWAKEEINAFVKSLGVKKTAIWTSTNDNLVLLHKAQMEIHEDDRSSKFHDSISRQSSFASDQEQKTSSPINEQSEINKDSDESKTSLVKENGNTELDKLSSEKNNDATKEVLHGNSESNADSDLNKDNITSKNEEKNGEGIEDAVTSKTQVENMPSEMIVENSCIDQDKTESENEQKIDDNQNDVNQNITGNSSPNSVIENKADDNSMESVTNSAFEITQTAEELATSDVVMQDITTVNSEPVFQNTLASSELESKSSESLKTSKVKKERRSVSHDREHKEKHKSLKKKHEKARRKTVDSVSTNKRKNSSDNEAKTSKQPIEEKSSIPQQPTFKPSEVSKLFPDVKEPGYVCPIQDCNRVFAHRHTISAHIRFRHKKTQTVAETLAETAKPAPDFGNISKREIENKIIKSRGWFLCVDAHIHEDEDEKVLDVSRDVDTRKFLIECVRNLFKRPLMSFNYNVACNFVTKWPTLKITKSQSPRTQDEDYFALPVDIGEHEINSDKSLVDTQEISEKEDTKVESELNRPTTPIPENDDNVDENDINPASSTKKIKKHKVKKFSKCTQTANFIKSNGDRVITPSIAPTKIKKLHKPKDSNPSPTVMTGLAFGKSPKRTIAAQTDFPATVSTNKRKTSKDIVKKLKPDVKSELKNDEVEAKRRETPKITTQEGTADKPEASVSILKKRMNKGMSFEQALTDPNAQERNQESKMKIAQKSAARSRSMSNSQPNTMTKPVTNISNVDLQKIKTTFPKSEEKRSKSGDRKRPKPEKHRKRSHDSSNSRDDRPSSPERLTSVEDYNNLIEHAKQIAGDDWSDSSKHSSNDRASTSKKKVNNNNADDSNAHNKHSMMIKKQKIKNKRSIDLRKLSVLTMEEEVVHKARKTDETRSNPLENMLSESTKFESSKGDKHKCGICGRIMANGFALACHMRKKHKSKAKMFIPENETKDEKGKAKVRKKSSDDARNNIKQAKNAEPVYQEGRLSTIKSAQAEEAALPLKVKSFKMLTKRQLAVHFFCELFYCPEYRQLVEKVKSFNKKTSLENLAKEIFSTGTNDKFLCPVPQCNDELVLYSCLHRHVAEKHSILINTVLRRTRYILVHDLIKKCLSCDAEFDDFTDLYMHVKQNQSCKDLTDIDQGVKYYHLGTFLAIQCPECESCLSNMRSLLRHFRVKHSKFTNYRKSKKWEDVLKNIEHTWHQMMNYSLANGGSLTTEEESPGIMVTDDDKSEADEELDDENEKDEVEHTTDSGIEAIHNHEDSTQEVNTTVETQQSASTDDDFYSVDDSQDDIFIPKACERHGSSSQDSDVTLDTSTIQHPTRHDSTSTSVDVLTSKPLVSESSVDNNSISEDSFLISDGNVSSEMDMDITEDTVDVRSKIGEAKNLRRLAYTQAARKIAMKTPEKFNRRRWAEFQNLHSLYNKRALKKVSLSLLPARKIETPETVESIEKPVETESLAIVKKISSGYCWLCKDGFLQGPNYINHILYHLRNIDRYENRCDFSGCLFAFKNDDELTEHQLLHEGGVHKCLFCFGPSYFASARDLLDHEKELHTSAVKLLRKLRKKFCINRFFKSELRRAESRQETTAIQIEESQTKNNEERFLCCRHRKRLDIRTDNGSNCACDGRNIQLCSSNCCQDDKVYCESVFLQNFIPEIQTNVCDIMFDVLDTLDEAELHPIELIENCEDLPPSFTSNFDILLSSTPQQNFMSLDEDEIKEDFLIETDIHPDITINISRIDSELVTTTTVSTCELSPLKVFSQSETKSIPMDIHSDIMQNVSRIDSEFVTMTTVSTCDLSPQNVVLSLSEAKSIEEDIHAEVMLPRINSELVTTTTVSTCELSPQKVMLSPSVAESIETNIQSDVRIRIPRINSELVTTTTVSTCELSPQRVMRSQSETESIETNIQSDVRIRIPRINSQLVTTTTVSTCELSPQRVMLSPSEKNIHSGVMLPRINSELATTTTVSTCELSPQKVMLSASETKLIEHDSDEDAENNTIITKAIIPYETPEIDCDNEKALEILPLNMDSIEISKPESQNVDNFVEAYEMDLENIQCQSNTPFDSTSTSFLNPEHGYIANLIQTISESDIERGLLYLEVASVLERIVTTVECASQCDKFEEMGCSEFIGLLPVSDTDYMGTEESVVALVNENENLALLDETLLPVTPGKYEPKTTSDNLMLSFRTSSNLQTDTTITILPETHVLEDKLSSDVKHHEDDDMLPHDGIHEETKSVVKLSHSHFKNIGCVLATSCDDTSYLCRLSVSKSVEASKRVFTNEYSVSSMQTDTLAIGWKKDEVDSVTTANLSDETNIEEALQNSSVSNVTTEENRNRDIPTSTINPTHNASSVSEEKVSNSDNYSTASVDQKSKCVKKSQGKKGRFISTDPFRHFRGRPSKHARNLEKQEIPEVWEPDEELFLKMFPSMAEENCESSVALEKKRSRKSSTSMPPPKKLRKSKSLDVQEMNTESSLIPTAKKLEKSKRRGTVSPVAFNGSKTDLNLPVSEQNEIVDTPSSIISNAVVTARSMLCFPTICGFCLDSVLAVDLLRHLLAHFQNPHNVICCLFGGNQCFYRCRNATELRVHYRRHLDLQPFLCMFCCAKFRDRATLDEHQNTLHRLFKKEFFAELRRRLDAKTTFAPTRPLPSSKFDLVSEISEVPSCKQVERPSVIVRPTPSCAVEDKSATQTNFPTKKVSTFKEKPISPIEKKFDTDKNDSCNNGAATSSLPREEMNQVSSVENGSVLVLDMGDKKDKDIGMVPPETTISEKTYLEASKNASIETTEKNHENFSTPIDSVEKSENFDGLAALANVCSLVEKVPREKAKNLNCNAVDDSLGTFQISKKVVETKSIKENILSQTMVIEAIQTVSPDLICREPILPSSKCNAVEDRNQAKQSSSFVQIPKSSPVNNSKKLNKLLRYDGTNYVPHNSPPITFVPRKRLYTENVSGNSGFQSHDWGNSEKMLNVSGDSTDLKVSTAQINNLNQAKDFDWNESLRFSPDIDGVFPFSNNNEQMDINHTQVGQMSPNTDFSEKCDTLSRLWCVDDIKKRKIINTEEAKSNIVFETQDNIKCNSIQHTEKVSSNYLTSTTCSQTSLFQMQTPKVRKVIKIIRPAPVTSSSNADTSSVPKALSCVMTADNLELNDSFKSRSTILYTSANKSAGIHVVQAANSKEPLCAVTRSPMSKRLISVSELNQRGYHGNYPFTTSMLLSSDLKNTKSNSNFDTDGNHSFHVATGAKDISSDFKPAFSESLADQNRNKNNANFNYPSSSFIRRSDDTNNIPSATIRNFRKLFTAKPLQSNKPPLRQITDSRFTCIPTYSSQQQVIRFVKPTARKVQIVRPVMRVTSTSNAEDKIPSQVSQNAIVQAPPNSRLVVHSTSAFQIIAPAQPNPISTIQQQSPAISNTNVSTMTTNPVVSHQNTVMSMLWSSFNDIAGPSVSKVLDLGSDNKNVSIDSNEIKKELVDVTVRSSPITIRSVSSEGDRSPGLSIVSIGIDEHGTDEGSDISYDDIWEHDNSGDCCRACEHIQDPNDETKNSNGLCSDCRSSTSDSGRYTKRQKTKTKKHDHKLMKEVWESKNKFLKRYCKNSVKRPCYMVKNCQWNDVARKAYEDLKAYAFRAISVAGDSVSFGILRCPIKNCEEIFQVRKKLYRHLCKHSTKKLIAFLRSRFNNNRNTYKSRSKKKRSHDFSEEIVHNKRCRFEGCERVFQCDATSSFQQMKNEFRRHMMRHSHFNCVVKKVGTTLFHVFESTVPLEDIVQQGEVKEDDSEVESESANQSTDMINVSVKLSPVSTKLMPQIDDVTNNLAQAKVSLVRLQNCAFNQDLVPEI